MDTVSNARSEALRNLPAVERILQEIDRGSRGNALARPLVTSIVREAIALRRERILSGGGQTESFEEILDSISSELVNLERSRLRGVINGTGVLLHTNLGRSPLGRAALDSVVEVAGGYSNLEFDLSEGERGKRGAFLERCLALSCGGEAATVVNNCAAALILILRHLASPNHPEVLISRGELIEIGGGFRIPEIMESSGASLHEVGTTNRTKISDYEKAIGPETGMLLKVHRSNFYQEGFVEEPKLEELVALGREREMPVVLDLGSGALVNTETVADIPHEMTIVEALKAGVDLVCISGDKLLGGPQAGIIAGKREYVNALKRNPLFRALRCDKMVFAALEESAVAYLETPENPSVVLLDLLRENLDTLRSRAEVIVSEFDESAVRIGEGKSRCGGGTMPKAEIPSIAIELKPKGLGPAEAARRLRTGAIAVVPYIAGDVLKIDLRTVLPTQDKDLGKALAELLSGV